MITDKELLALAGKLATASDTVINSDALHVSEAIRKLALALYDYNNAIYERIDKDW